MKCLDPVARADRTRPATLLISASTVPTSHPLPRRKVFSEENIWWGRLCLVDYVVLAALAEPNRVRIVELLNRAPRWLGEIAAELGLRQPQATKHLQTLQNAGLVTMHPLGQRRIYTLRREPLRELRQWLDALDTAHPAEHIFGRYVTAIASERAQAARDPGWATGRRIRPQRQPPAGQRLRADSTSPALVRQWWSPEHFDVAECDIDPVPGGRPEITMRAADGGRYPSRGHFLTVIPPQRLRFELSHLAANQTPVFTAIHDLHLTDHGQRTQLNLTIRVTAASPAAPAAVAGIQPGWEQLLKQAHPHAHPRHPGPAPGPASAPGPANPKPTTTPKRPFRPGGATRGPRRDRRR